MPKLWKYLRRLPEIPSPPIEMDSEKDHLHLPFQYPKVSVFSFVNS